MVNFRSNHLRLENPPWGNDPLQDERSLLAAARRLDPDALGQIHDLYYQPLFRYIAYRVPDVATAEDMAADVFRRLLDALHDGKPPRRTLRGWLYQVASNIVSDHYRQRERTPEAALDEQMAADDSVIETVLLSLRRQAVVDAARRLTDEQQRVLALRFGAGLAIREVAEVLGKSEAAVKMLQARAVAALAEELA